MFDDKVVLVTGGFTTGLAVEAAGDGVVVNSLAPNRVVPALCRPGAPTGRVALSHDLLDELRIR